jgi:hypothetical protein
MGYADAARGGKGVKPNRLLQTLVGALQARGVATVAGADRLAALAYRIGRYDLAQALVDRQHSALSSWVKAKLALRRGDTVGAAQAYADAVKSFPQADVSLEPVSVELLKAEQGVLTLSRGQYVEALNQLYLATTGGYRENVNANTFFGRYTNDMLYVAERVVTTDELRYYVDAHIPAPPSAKPVNAAAMTDAQYRQWQESHPKLMADRLRLLLARRLMREDRIKEALLYFPEDDDARFVDRAGNHNGYGGDGNESSITGTAVPLRRTAREYGEAVSDGRRGWRSVTRAEGWYRAATLARQRGMEIMGYEQGPDFSEYDGNYEGGADRTPMLAGDQDPVAATAMARSTATSKATTTASTTASTTTETGKAPPVADTPQARAAAELAGPFVSDGERIRYAASESMPNRRYHYRDVAANYAMLAADLLPPRSQAFAAVLCQGAGFVYYDERAKSFYARYVKEGAAVSFAEYFGGACAQPDFSAAARFPYVQLWRAAQRWTHVHRRLTIAAGCMMLSVAAVTVVWRRRRRKRDAARNTRAA